jgi:hypothetical protein
MAKKIINGRMYNTDTTEVLGSWDNGYPRGDFSFEEQTLQQVNILFMLLVAHSQILVTVMEDMIALVKNLSRCLWNRLSNGRKNI